jgi:hypothetical protein
MPAPDRLLATLRRAMDAVRATPGRVGHVVGLDDAADVLVVGDLHGHLGNFQKALEKADLGRNPGRHLVLQEVIHGPYRYADGSDKSHQMVDLFAALKCQYPRQAHYLLGNHELAQWTNRTIAKSEIDLNTLFVEGVFSAYGVHADGIYSAYRDLFALLPVAIRTPNRVFLSHSLPGARKRGAFDMKSLESDRLAEADLFVGGSVHSLVWGRDVSEENATAFLNAVDADWLITGHIACDGGFSLPNQRQVILDTAASPGGYCLFPTAPRLTHDDLRGCVHVF